MKKAHQIGNYQCQCHLANNSMNIQKFRMINNMPYNSLGICNNSLTTYFLRNTHGTLQECINSNL